MKISENTSWTTDEEQEEENGTETTTTEVSSSSQLVARRPGKEIMVENGESSKNGHSELVNHFLAMNFPPELVLRVVTDNGEDDPNLILSLLLSTTASRDAAQHHLMDSLSSSSSDYNENVEQDSDSLDMDGWLSDDEIEDNSNPNSEWRNMLLSKERAGTLSQSEHKLLALADMGYTKEESSVALERCGPDASESVLIDCILAAQVAREDDFYLPEDKPRPFHSNGSGNMKKRKFNQISKKKNLEEEECIHLPNPMIGYGVPFMESEQIRRPIPEVGKGPPYFYYENVACAPKGAWDKISRFLYEIEPEFVDSKYFCATARKRGYVHNLPIENRYPLIPLPHMTIFEAFPSSQRFWPSWDTRKKMNCILTSLASAQLTEKIRAVLEGYDGTPPESVQKMVLKECRKWNLIWTGKNRVAPLEPYEMEKLLGFPKDHTRGGGVSRTDRIKSLGNSFQVDTVMYHLSVLKDMFPNGMNVLSLFSGIGGAEVALHRLGIKLKTVVSVEKLKVNRDIVRSWWEDTKQEGTLIDNFDDVQQLDDITLEQMIGSIGGFDLVIGGSPCNNLAGGNRISRDGLDGKESVLFYEYFRILDAVRSIMKRMSE